MKLSLYEGTSRAKAKLIITDQRSVVIARKRERSISKKGDKSVRFFLEEVIDSTPNFDTGKGTFRGQWTNYQNNDNRNAALTLKQTNYRGKGKSQ